MFHRRYFVALSILLATSGNAVASSEIVVAVRYLQAEGLSHSHLFLYRPDGKLLRQLTKSDAGQDIDPIFAPDGESIVFTRKLPQDKIEWWTVSPHGTNLRQLTVAPDWYTGAKTAPFFDWPEPNPDDPEFGERSPTFRAPDGSVELVLHEVKEDEDDTVNQPGHGKHYIFRDLRSGEEIEFAKLDGFEGAVDQLNLHDSSDRFLLDPPLRVAFFGVHLGSTDGSTDYALDLVKRKLVRLAKNWAVPVPLPGDAAFLSLTEARYVPIPGSTKTANCSYIEWWNSDLQRIRFARAAAAITYGASAYRPGKTPAVVTIRSDRQ
jgi:hypothetical protein